MPISLDYSLKTPQQRTQLVRRICQQADPASLTPHYLEILSNYIIQSRNKQQRKGRKILTNNRLVTINKRQTSYQGLAAKLQKGQDGIYNLIATNARNTYLSPHIQITQADLKEIPGLADIQESIQKIQQQAKNSSGKQRFLLRKQLIQMREQQYILKSQYRQPVYCVNLTRTFNQIQFYDDIIIDQNGEPINRGPISFFNPAHISALLCNYTALSSQCRAALTSDSWYLIRDFNNLLSNALAAYPLYWDIIWGKMMGYSNLEIQQYLQQHHGVHHTVQYISSLWRNKIPKLIADYAKREYLLYHFTFEERGRWKTCSRCGITKLAHPYFFSRNSTSRDGFYSICKDCRNHRSDSLGQPPLTYKPVFSSSVKGEND